MIGHSRFQDVKSNLDQPRFSSSALDAEGLLLQLGLFWKNLEWPVPTDAFGYLCSIVEVSILIVACSGDPLNPAHIRI